MEKTTNRPTRIRIGELELWTAPFGENRATITAVEAGTKKTLQLLHQKMPEVFELMVDEDEFCDEDMDGAFSVIVDPEQVALNIMPGSGRFAFGVSEACDGDCEHCEWNCDDVDNVDEAVFLDATALEKPPFDV